MENQLVVVSRSDRDAIEIGDLYRKGKSSLLESVRYMIEAGQRLAAKKETLAHGEWLPWLEDNADVLGFDSRQTAHKLMKMANVASTRHLNEEEARDLSRHIWGNENLPRSALGTGNNEWNTPEEYVEMVRKVLGTIDLDPASNAKAQKYIQAKKFYTKKDNGLLLPWEGKVFLNPPYAQPLMKQFVDKMVEERLSGNVPAAIMLTNNYTDTIWWHRAAKNADAICFLLGRVRFVDDSETECPNPAQGQTFFYFGDEVDKFASVFVDIGFVVRL